MKWFAGEDCGASQWSLGFKPWWMYALMYVMCIFINVSCINMIYETCIMKFSVQTLMSVCVNVHNVYTHWCMMYKYDIWNMYDGSEYLQNILLKNPFLN